MCGLALLVHEFGIKVTGSDITESENSTFLRNKQISIAIGHNRGNIAKPDIVVYSSAIKDSNPELSFAVERQIEVIKRGHFLAKIALCFPASIAIAGSHGKTTVASMLTHILIQNQKSPAYLIGGKGIDLKDYAAAGNGTILVAEADESDGTLSNIKCPYGIITNMGNDHFWNFKSIDDLYTCFERFAFSTQYLLAFDSIRSRTMFSNHPNCTFIADNAVNQISTLPLLGIHNKVNALFAIVMAEQLGIDRNDSIKSMMTFNGVDRRLSLRYSSKDLLIYEDYAHHPTEIRASINAIKERYPSKKLRIIFQPHRAERITYYCNELAIELEKANELYVVPIFEAWTNNENLVNGSDIIRKINSIPAFYYDLSFDNLAKHVIQSSKKNDAIIVMGPGDITKLIPILTQRLT